jgi:hypothetical protein
VNGAVPPAGLNRRLAGSPTVGVPEIPSEIVIGGSTARVYEAVAVGHSGADVTVTEYVVVVAGETVIVCVVSPPGDQEYVA